MADKHTRWIIEASSNIPDINTQLERLIKLQMEQNQLTQQNTTSTALAIQRQREQVEAMVDAQSKSNTGSKQQLDTMGLLRKEYDLLSKTLNGLVNLAAGAWAVGQIKTYVMEVISAKSAQDGFVASMEQMLGSRLKAEELNAKLINIALKSPFDIVQLQEVTKKLQGMGVETEKIIPYINMLGDISAIVGTQKLPLIAKALTDVQSKHTLMAQEIRQFTDNGVPLYDLLAKSMQKPVEEIRKLATEHKIVFEDVEKALMQATQKGGIYYNQMATQSEQLGGKITNLNDLFTIGKAKVGDYFENGIRAGIKTMGSFIQETIGSVNAIERTITSLKAALALWISYRTAMISIEAAQRANNVTTLANLGAIEAQKVATVGLTISTTSLSTAFNGLRVAFMANPFGFVATAITSLISLFYAYKAVNIEVSEAQSVEAEALRKTNQEITNAITRVKGLTEGTVERKKATEELITKYPELFKNLQAESLNNAVLEHALTKVNNQYREKIQLAIIDGKNSALLEKQMQIETDRYELLIKLREKYKGQSAQYADDSAFLAALAQMDASINATQGTAVLGNRNLFGVDIMIAQAKALETESKRVQDSITKNANEQSKIRVKIERESQLEMMKDLSDRLAKGEITQKEYNKAISDGTFEVVKKQVKAVEEGEDAKKKAKKSSVELSLENDLAELKSAEQTFAVKMLYLDKEEQLKKEQAKRLLTNNDDEQERILSIERQYQNKRVALITDYANTIMAGTLKHFDDQLAAAGKQNKKLYTIQGDLEFSIEQSQKRIEKLKERTNEIERTNAEDQSRYNEQYYADALGREGSFWKSREEIIQDSYVVSSAVRINDWMKERSDLEAKAALIKDSVIKQEEYQETLKQIAILNGKIAKEEYEQWVANNKAIELRAERIKEVARALLSLGDGIQQVKFENFRKRIDEISDSASQFFDSIEKANKESFDKIVESGTLSLDELNKEWDKYAEKQMQVLTSKSNFEIAKGELESVSESARQLQKDANQFISQLTDGKYLAAFTGLITGIINGFKQANEFKAMLDQREAQADIDKIRRQEELVQERLDFTIKAIQKEFDAYKESVDKQIAAEEAKADKLKSIAEQNASDNELRLQKDDQYRNELLLAGEAREVALLEAAKERQIDKAISENKTKAEVARITMAFDELIADKHAEYQDAQYDKTKGVSLATKEVKAQEKDEIIQIQKDLTHTLGVFADKVKEASVNATNSILDAQRNAANEMRHLKHQEFEAEKKMMLLQIDSEIAKEIAKGAQSNPAIVFALRVQGAEIQKMQNPYFHGTPFVELGDNPDGVDTVQARLHKGERIVPHYINQFLGRDVTNEQLAHGYLQYANFMDRLPSMEIPTAPAINLPDFTQIRQASISMDRVEEKLDKLNKTFASKSLINVNIDANNVTVSEQWENHKANYYNALFNK
jgi:tape measure domain-containing protein